MKKSQFLIWLLQLVTICVFAQNKTFSSYVESQFENEEGVVQFVKFDETSKLNYGNRSDLLKEFLEVSENTSFVQIDSKTDKIGILHETFQQYFNHIPVEFGIYKAHLKNGKISAISGDYFPIKEINTTPTVTDIGALSMAKNHVKSEKYYDSSMNNIGYSGPQPTLVVFPKMKGINAENRLAYRLDIYSEKPLYRADVYVDAHTGDVIFENSKIHHSNQPASGTTLYNNIQNFTADSFTGGYRLRQTTAEGTDIQTFDAISGVQNATDIISSTTNFTTNAAAVQAHWGTEQAYEYFWQEHNRNSFDGNGALIKSYITPPSASPYASWTGSVMHYSIGYAPYFGPLTSLDIVGHEYTHAVIDHSADLIFSYESGAINESYADIFGEMVEHHAQGSNDWLCGDDVFIGGARSMSDPKSKFHPDTYQGEYWQNTYISNNNDNFGVHTNSGVHNKWFYLLAVGGSGINDNGLNYTVNGIGIEKAAEIAYRNLTWYLTPTSDFHYTCESSIYAAIQLFGPNSPEAIATAQAWRAVGLLIPQTDYIAPTTPLNLVSSNATEYIIPLSWDASTDNVGVLGYTVLLEGSIFGSWSTPNTSFTAQGPGVYLQPNTNNEFRVVAFDAAGNISQYSNTVNVFFDTIDPSSPTNLTSSNTTQTTTDLSWTASTDNLGVTGYEIYQNPGNVYLETVTGTNYTVTGLTENYNYSFYVKAIDAAGNDSSPSNTVNVTTLMSCTGGNGNLTLAITNNDQYLGLMTLRWFIKDANNNWVAQGGPYPTQSFGSTLVENIALGPGLYTFDFLDLYGFGNSFELKNNSNQMIVSTSTWNNLPFQFCVDASGIRVSSSTDKLPNSSTNMSGSIYPNPVLDKLHYRHLDIKKRNYSVVDITGKTFMKGALDSENSIDVSQLQSGLYILRVFSEEESEYHKFIKK